MAELPVDLIYDILSRMPIKSLDRFRCVCKQWCKYIDEPNLAIIQMNRAAEEPIPIMSKRPPRWFNRLPPPPNLRQILTLFRIIEGTTSPKAKKKFFLEFESCNGVPCPEIHRVQGSCNGLLYLSHHSNIRETTLSVIHPLRNQSYELPRILSIMTSCGLGFDASTNTFKMCVSVRQNYKTYHIMVHVLGTNLWREIPQVPYYHMIDPGVFAHGCLHWLGYHNQMPDASWLGIVRRFPPTHGFKVISFDIRKEEFGLIDPPRKIRVDWIESMLVDLHGEVGLVYERKHLRSLELWVLKQNQWVFKCRLDVKPPLPRDWIHIVGLWNKSGDILVAINSWKRFFVYSLKSQDFHEVNLVGRKDGCDAFIHMYRSSLFSVPGIKKSVSIRSNPTRFKACTSKKRKSLFHPK